MKIVNTIRTLFLILFIATNAYIYIFALKLDDREGCNDDCTDDWRRRYILYSSLVAGINGIINLFIPINKMFSKFFLIGGVFATTILVGLALQIYCLLKYFKKLESEQCSNCLSRTDKKVADYVLSFSITGYIAFIIVLALTLLYL